MTTCTTTLRCGDTLHVLVASTADELAGLVERKRRQLVKPNGQAVVDASGRTVFVIDEIVNPLQWHEDGNRVRANRVQREVAADGTIASTVLRQVWTTI